jgi:hypothetical protein
MRHLKVMGLVATLACAIVASIGVSPAAATTACVSGTVVAPCTGGHPGGAFVLTGTGTGAPTGFSLGISGAPTILCSDTQISGTAPATSATTLSIPVSLTQTNCSFGIPMVATAPTACQAHGASAIRLNLMWNQSAAPQGSMSLTIPSGCTITYENAAIACTLTIAGPQTIGNGGTGVGGGGWTNGVSPVFSSADFNSMTIPLVTSSGGNPACPAAGAHTGFLGGQMSVASPTSAPGMTLIS